jgi:hypothetical protein
MMTDFLREDLTKVVSTQQEALAGYVARDIDFKIQERKKLLENLAQTLPLQMLSKPAEMKAWLRERHHLQPLFSQGIFLTNLFIDRVTPTK